MSGASSRGSQPKSKKRWWNSDWWTVKRVSVATVLLLAATLVIGYVAVPFFLEWLRGRDPKGGNTATNSTSSAVVQGGNVGSVTVHNYPPGGTLTPEPSPSPTTTPTPTPTTPVAGRSPAPSSSPTARRQEPPLPPSAGAGQNERDAQPSPTSRPATTSSFVWGMVSECEKHDRSDRLGLGESYSDDDIGLVVRNAGRAEDDPLLQLQMPGETKVRQIPFFKPYREGKRKDGCLYSFYAEKAPGIAIKFTFKGSGEKATKGAPEQ